MFRASPYESLQVDALLQRAAVVEIDRGSGLAVFDGWLRSGRRVYDAAVAPALRSAGLNAGAMVGVFDSDSSLARVVRAVQSAEVIVVDVSTLNPCVFYVLGLSHALGRCPLLITRGGEATLPFDLRTLRCIHYGEGAGHLLELRAELTRALRVFRANSDGSTDTSTT